MTVSLLLSVLASAASADVGYEAFFKSSPDNLMPHQCFDAPGMPASVQGTYINGGPALFEMGGRSFQSYLDGFAKMNSFKLGGGKVCFGTRMMLSNYYNTSIKDGTIAPGALFMETSPPRKCPTFHPFCNMAASVVADNNYVNSVKLTADAGKLLMVSDTTEMVELDLDELKVIGDHKWNDDMIQSHHKGVLGSAHPLPDPSGNGYIAFAAEIAEGPFKNWVDVYRLQNGNRTLITRYAAKEAPYFHSFGVTEQYVVFPHNIAFSMVGLLETFGGTMGKALVTDMAGIHVVKHTAGHADEAPLVFPWGDKEFYHVHVVNTYENASGIVLDCGGGDTDVFTGKVGHMDTMLNKTKRDAIEKQHIMRFVLHTTGDKQGTVTSEPISVPGRATEFPKVNPNFQGKPYCVYYATEWFHDDASYASMAVLQYNTCTGERKYWYKQDWYPSEAIFVPTGAAETDGLLLMVVLDGTTEVSHFIAVDAKTMTQVEDIVLPRRIPFTGHGEFWPSTQAATAAAPAEVLV